MAYIRKNTEELTGYQQRGALKPSIDLCNDFVMVYGIGKICYPIRESKKCDVAQMR